MVTDKLILKNEKCALIRSGGGTGPMKPGNRWVADAQNGANSCRRFSSDR